MKGRQYRRAQLERIKRKRVKGVIERSLWRDTPSNIAQGRMAHTGTSCSCSMCRNPRRSGFGKHKDRITMQERRIELAENE